MKNLVERRIDTVDRWGNPAVEVRYEYQEFNYGEKNFNEYMDVRGGKAYRDSAHDKFCMIMMGFVMAFVLLILLPIEYIKTLFKKN